MPFLLDSDWVIDYLLDVPEALQLLDRLAGEGISISVLTYMEVYQGVIRSPRSGEAEQQLRAFLQNVPILTLSLAVARRCARLRDTLRRQGKNVNRRAIDLLIAATALELDVPVVTRNFSDYRDIPGLKLYTPPQG